MGEVSYVLSALLLIASLAYIIYFRPKFEEDRDNLIFDNRVLAFIDGLYFSGIDFRCSIYDLRPYVEHQLIKAHQLPGNQFLIEYTAKNGYSYCSHTGKNDYALFAILCIVQYAKERDIDHLVSWCESELEHARKYGIHF